MFILRFIIWILTHIKLGYIDAKAKRREALEAQEIKLLCAKYKLPDPDDPEWYIAEETKHPAHPCGAHFRDGGWGPHCSYSNYKIVESRVYEEAVLNSMRERRILDVFLEGSKAPKQLPPAKESLTTISLEQMKALQLHKEITYKNL